MAVRMMEDPPVPEGREANRTEPEERLNFASDGDYQCVTILIGQSTRSMDHR